MNEHRLIVLQERDRHLLRELSVMRVIDREQAKKVAGFGSTTRANTRLLRLTNSGLLRQFFMGTVAGGAKALYTLSKRGASEVGAPYRHFRRAAGQALVADFSVQHQLAVNEVYCALKYRLCPVNRIAFRRWLSFQTELAPDLGLIPDGYAEFDTPDERFALFIEVDLGHERLKVWEDKVAGYIALADRGLIQELFSLRRSRTLVIAHSAGRMQTIREALKEITDKTFSFTTLAAVSKDPFGPIWLRPLGDKPQPLFQELP